jgi:hypothetical protein
MKNCLYTKVFKFFVSKVIRVTPVQSLSVAAVTNATSRRVHSSPSMCAQHRTGASTLRQARSLDLQTAHAHAQATPMPPRNEYAVAGGGGSSNRSNRRHQQRQTRCDDTDLVPSESEKPNFRPSTKARTAGNSVFHYCFRFPKIRRKWHKCNRKSLQPRHLRCLGLFSPHVKLNQISVKLQSNWAPRAEALEGPRRGCSTTTRSGLTVSSAESSRNLT